MDFGFRQVLTLPGAESMLTSLSPAKTIWQAGE
jgi:hypothetical protein